MPNFERMIVIPQEEYLTMSNLQNVREPLTEQFHNLENHYTQDERIRDPYKRLMLQSSTLDDMMNLKEQIRNSLTVSTPKPYQNRAKALFQSIESFLKFNDKGEIYDSNDSVISHSRVEDLIQHAVRDRRRNMIPTGWNYFLNVLREHNVPKSILNRNTLDELDQSKVSTTPSPMKIKKEATTPSKIPKPKAAKARTQPSRKARSGLDFLKSYK